MIPEDWDLETKRTTVNSAEGKRVNKTLTYFEDDIDKVLTHLQFQYSFVSATMIKNVYLGFPPHYLGAKTKKAKAQRVEQYTSLLEAYDHFIAGFEVEVKAKLKSDGTLRHWRSNRHKVAIYIKSRFNKSDIELTEIKPTFATDFFTFLTTRVEEPLSKVTANGEIKRLKQILKICSEAEIISKNPIASYKCGGESQVVIPLEMAEVLAIFNKKISIKRLEEVQDAYIFQCFTGFAYQDAYGLGPENIIVYGNNGERWLTKHRGKTNIYEMVPMLPVVETIIQKYKDHPYCKANNCLLPINSNYRYNCYLKELADICGVRRALNTHLARHTFADIMLNNGVPLEDVSKMLGHKNIRTTQRYCRVNKQENK